MLNFTFKFSIDRKLKQSLEPQVLRVSTDVDHWEPVHICSRHYEFRSQDKRFRGTFVANEDKDEEYLKQNALKYAKDAIEKINSIAMLY